MTTGLLITTAGQAAIATDLSGGANLVLTHVAFGDANGVPYNPVEAQTQLVRERYRATIASVAVLANEIIVDAIIPADTPDATARPSHGFNVAECGLFAADGTMIGVARMGNGFKPSPASGQAAIATYRLKLAVANPSAISVVIDPQAQIILGRHVRPFWLTVDGVLNAPPPNPAAGATYIIGAVPTGAWTGFAHRLAQWVGVWSLAEVPEGHIVCDRSADLVGSSRFLRREAGGWVSAVVSATAGGLITPAVLRAQALNFLTAAAVAGTANAVTLACQPAFPAVAALVGVPLRFLAEANATAQPTINVDGLGPINSLGALWRAGDLVEIMHDGTTFRHAVIGPQRPAAMFYARLGANQIIPASTATLVSGWSMVQSRLVDSVLAAGGLTVGTRDAGIWQIGAHLRYGFPVADDMDSNIILKVNGVEWDGGNAHGTSSIRARPNVMTTVLLAAGDVVTIETSHDSSTVDIGIAGLPAVGDICTFHGVKIGDLA